MAPLNRSQSSLKPQTLQHASHPKHPLQLVNIPQLEFLCNACGALGSGTRYRCGPCDYDIHEVCATCPDLISSPLHSSHSLILNKHPVNDRCCDICGDQVHSLFYTCRACDFDVHPLCTLLPLHAKLPVHPQHLLKLQTWNAAGCALCFQVCTSWRYRCECCSLDIHLECVLGGGGTNCDVSSQKTAFVGTCDHASQKKVAACQARAVQPPLQQAGFGGYAVGVPAGCGGGYEGYAMPGPMMMISQPSYNKIDYYGGSGYGKPGMMISQPHQTSKIGYEYQYGPNYGMPGMMMGQPQTSKIGYGYEDASDYGMPGPSKPDQSNMNHDHGGHSDSSSSNSTKGRRRKIYAVVGRIAASVALSSIGVPLLF